MAGSLYQLDVYGTAGNNYYNSFWNCNVGVRAADLYKVHGDYSRMYSTNTTGAVVSNFGYQAASSQYYDVQVNYNSIFNIVNGISFIRTTPPSGANPASGEVSVSNNNISATNPAGLPPTAGEYVFKAISYQNLIVTGAIYGQTNLNNNVLTGVYNGIYANNTIGQLLTADNNNIIVCQDPAATSAPQNGISIINNNQSNVYIYDNIVTGPGYNVPVPLPFYGAPIIQGISAVTGNSGTCYNECNLVQDINTGFYFGGTNYAKWGQNTMQRNAYGFAINGITYGFPNTTGNVWSTSTSGGFPGWVGSNYNTYTIGATMGAISPMYVYSSDPTQIPGNNFGAVPFYFYAIGSGIYLSTLPEFTCYPPLPSSVPEEAAIHIMKQTAQKQLGYTTQTAQKNWIAQLDIWRATNATTMYDTISVLDSFKAMADSLSRYKYITGLESYIAAGDYTAADSMLGYTTDSMANTDSNAATGAVIADTTDANGIVENYKSYFRLLIKYQADTLTGDDSTAITALANMCPYVDGSIIYNARALYSLIYNDLSNFSDLGCENVQGQGGNGNSDSRISSRGIKDSVIALAQNYTLYPNPNDGNITLTQDRPNNEPVQINVLNAIGVGVYNANFIFTGGKAQLNMSNYAAGLYMLRLTDPSGKVFTFKFVIE